ncbi:MAG: phosphonate C-P lyase system protein PhnH [Octadecabacter sp.]|nr:phosphonate C-P lyase system protein PhnH [Octadecabacter sp.]
MLNTPVQGVDEAAANKTFEALLWALSRPGLASNLSAASDEAIIDALIDRECRVYSADPQLMSNILCSGATVSEVKDADHVFLGALRDLASLDDISKGSALYPNEGATVVLRVALNKGRKIRLSGPGVKTVLDIQIAGLPDGFWQNRAEMFCYPAGFDLFLRDGRQVIGIPRSTIVEVL